MDGGDKLPHAHTVNYGHIYSPNTCELCDPIWDPTDRGPDTVEPVEALVGTVEVPTPLAFPMTVSIRVTAFVTDSCQNTGGDAKKKRRQASRSSGARQGKQAIDRVSPTRPLKASRQTTPH